MALYGAHGKTQYSITPSDKEIVQGFLEEISKEEPKKAEEFLRQFPNKSDPAWQRYVEGIYSHPNTWWTGIIQTQMVLGIWGTKRQAEALLRQSALARILNSLLAEDKQEQTQKLVSEIIRFQLKYRKANIAGRIHGGFFTNYASMGGRYGGTLSRGVKWSVRITNFTIASFGAAIKAIVQGKATSDAIINAIITGAPENLPPGFKTKVKNLPATEEEKKMTSVVLGELYGVDALNQTQPAPVSIKEFCSRPENIDLKGICK